MANTTGVAQADGVKGVKQRGPAEDVCDDVHGQACSLFPVIDTGVAFNWSVRHA